ncbi:MAG TPA: alkaline phosphatase family protein [Candidatus Cybelea sp.]|nr:alkaline phosphatase family protein [Candidatus Cybelea sp.]
MKFFPVIAALAAVAALAGCNSNSVTVPPPTLAPSTPIQHVVILMQENRSFNNIFAGFPGATSALVGKCERTPWCKTGKATLKPVTLETTNQLGLGTDIDHSHNGFKIECDFDKSTQMCRNDGFDKIRFGESGIGERAKLYPYAYIERSESKPYWDFAKHYALSDDIFFTDTASSFIAHQIILSGTVALNSHESLTDQPDAQPWGCDAPKGTTTPVLFKDGREKFNGPFPCFTQYQTIADLLDAKKVSWTFYVAPFQGKDADFSGGVWNGWDAIKKIRYSHDWNVNISRPNTNLFSDLKSGNLSSVSWVIPILADSDHPASGCNHGPRWVTSVMNAIGQSKYWNSTAVILLWDDWGGWYDPVPPPQINYTSLGFRVPMVVVSPWVHAGSVVHTQYQFGSILRFIEDTWNLGSLGTTDATSTSIGDMFDYTQKPLPYNPEPLPHIKSCTGNPNASEIIEHDGGVPE